MRARAGPTSLAITSNPPPAPLGQLRKLVIYILEGEGYSVVEGERHDWEAGDLLLLPLLPGGVEHQHFNTKDDKPAKWIAFISPPLFQWGASEMVQIEEHPEYQEYQEYQRRLRAGR